MVADLADGTVALEAVPRGVRVEMGGLSGMPTRYLFVAGGIGDVRMVVFVGSHDGRPAEVARPKNGVMIRVCRMRIVEVVEIATLAGKYGGVRGRRPCKDRRGGEWWKERD